MPQKQYSFAFVGKDEYNQKCDGYVKVEADPVVTQEFIKQEIISNLNKSGIKVCSLLLVNNQEAN